MLFLYTFYQKIIDAEPNNYVSYYLWGLKHSSFTSDGTNGAWEGGREQYLKVVEITTKIIKTNPHDVNALWYRGKCREHLNCFKRAINDFSKIIVINPTHVEAYKSRGNLKLWAGNSKSKDLLGAIKDYSKVIELTNDNSIYFLRAWAKQELHLYQEAIDDYTLGIEAGNNDYYFYRAKAKEIINDFEGSIQDYLKGIEIAPNFRYYMRLCQIYYNRKDFNQAQIYFDKTIELSPDTEEKDMYLYFKTDAPF